MNVLLGGSVVDGVFEAITDGVAQSEVKSQQHRSRSRFTRPLDSMRRPLPKCKPTCANASCAPLWHAATLRACDAKDMAACASSSSHSGGFSVDAGVRIEAPDRAGLERLLRYCARPPFAMERLKQRGADLVYRYGKEHSEPLQSDKYPAELVLTPLELIDRIAQLVPPPRTHRHHYYGVLAPNSPLRGAVTAMAQLAAPVPACSPVPEAANANANADAGTTVTAVAVGGSGVVAQPAPQVKPKPRPPAHYL